MKLKKNDYQELRKGGVKAIDTKLAELSGELVKTTIAKMKNELKNLREPGLIRRAIAKLKTIRAELKGAK
ncbi:MAG: 50S ribosomal protein L29 [bacterium]